MKLLCTFIIVLVAMTVHAQTYVYAAVSRDYIDVNSRREVTINTGDKLKYFKDGDENTKIYQTSKGNQVEIQDYFLITLKEYQSMVKKYGQRMTISALKNEIKEGMHEDLVTWFMGDYTNKVTGKKAYALVYNTTDYDGSSKYIYVTFGLNHKVIAVATLSGNLMDGMEMEVKYKGKTEKKKL